MVDLYRELVFTALNDILTPAIDDHNTYTIGERVVRSVGIEMFKLPNIHQIVINGCLTEVENKNSQLNTEQRQQQPHNGTISLIPSISTYVVTFICFVFTIIIVYECLSLLSRISIICSSCKCCFMHTFGGGYLFT